MVIASLLQEVDDSKINQVLEVLKGDGDWPFSFLMHQTIKMMQDLKKNNFNNIKQRLFTVGSNVDGGTFVVLSTFRGGSSAVTYVHVYSSGEEPPDVAQALQGDAVPWASDLLVFDVVYGSVRPFVLAALQSKGVQYSEATTSLYWINPDDGHQLDERTTPSEVTVMFLNEGHAKEVNDRWALKFQNSEHVIKDCILSSVGMGVVRKSDKKLLSYVLCNHAGALFVVHVGAEGHGELLVPAVVRETLKRGRSPVAVVANKDSAVETLLKQFHFVPFIPTKYYAVLSP